MHARLTGLRVGILVASIVAGSAGPAFAGRIVLSNDEWVTSNTGFSLSPTVSQFVQNVATFFTGGGPGTFLVHSDNFSLDDSLATMLRDTMTGAGHTWVDSDTVPGFTFDLATLLSYDGVFLALPPAVDQTVLTAYVSAGGNVYINAGTGVGGAAAEAAAWNTFLNGFGLNFVPVYNGISGSVPIVSASSLMAGVSSLYHNNGNSITLVGVDPFAQIIAVSSGGAGLFAVYDETDGPPPVPEPAALLLLSAGGAWVAARRRTARRR